MLENGGEDSGSEKGGVPQSQRLELDAMQDSESASGFLSLLYELAQILSKTADVKASLDSALVLLAKRLHMMRGTITLVSPQTGEIRIESSYGLKASESMRGHYVQGEGIIGRVVQTGQPMYVSKVSKEPRFLNRTRSRDLSKEEISYICVPICLNSQVLGALSVDRLFQGERRVDDELHVLTIIAMLLGFSAWEAQGEMDGRGKKTSGNPEGFVGGSECMRRVYDQILLVAQTSTTVFLHGESGTGKELAARAIHLASNRASKPFISINCAALPESLIESELFGHEKGAFTGAFSLRKGRFEQADGGTLFLDEVGELSMTTQAKLLRVLQERSFERVGGMESLHVDVRCITATNRDLTSMVEEGTFRRDLFYRLNVFPIVLPPLRERQDDILPLASHFVERFARKAGRGDIRLSLAVMDMLQRYSWPGNIRELENAMEHAVVLVGSQGVILPQHLPPAMHLYGYKPSKGSKGQRVLVSATLQQRMDELECACIIEALESSGGQIGKAAQALGLTPRIFSLRLAKYDIDYKNFRKRSSKGKKS